MSEDHTKRIVVGVDFGPEGDEALREAILLARSLSDSELHPVHAIKAPGRRGRSEHLDALSHFLSTGAEELRGRTMNAARVLGNGELWEQRATVHVRFGRPADVIHQVAVDVDADWIVVGTHGRRGVERLILGSVAEELLRSARIPVVVARRKNFDGAKKTPKLDVARPDEDLHAPRSFSRSELLHFGKRDSHIGGLI